MFSPWRPTDLYLLVMPLGRSSGISTAVFPRRWWNGLAETGAAGCPQHPATREAPHDSHPFGLAQLDAQPSSLPRWLERRVFAAVVRSCPGYRQGELREGVRHTSDTFCVAGPV